MGVVQLFIYALRHCLHVNSPVKMMKDMRIPFSALHIKLAESKIFIIVHVLSLTRKDNY